MTTKQQMLEAQKLLKSGQYEKAIAILATIDHPTADKWRQRAESLIASQNRQTTEKHNQRTAILSCAYFLLCGFMFLLCTLIIPAFYG